MTVTEIKREPDRVCKDCGKPFILSLSVLGDRDGTGERVTVCPRCGSPNHMQYVEAENEDINVEMPDDWQHPMEKRAVAIYERLLVMTGWRDVKVKLWLQTPNPMLGMVAPEVMIMAGEDRCARLEKFIDEAEELNKAWHEQPDEEG